MLLSRAMKAAGMSWVTCSLLLTAALAAATPANDRPSNIGDLSIPDTHRLTPLETFSNGFPKEFAYNLPTQEFMGDFARRYKRQAGITSAIDGILSAPYGGFTANTHLQALLFRNANVRPARQSAGSIRPVSPTSFSSSSSPQTFSPSSPQTFPPSSGASPQTFSQSSGASPQTFPPSSGASPQTFSQSSGASPQTFSQSSGASPQTFSPSPGASPQTFSPSSGASRQTFSPSFVAPPPRPQPQAFRPQRQTASSSPAAPPPSRRRPPSRPSNFRVIHERPSPSPPRLSPSARERPTPSQKPFSSSSFTGHQISSTFSDFDSFFESARLPRQRRDVSARQDVSAQLSQIINAPYEDAEEAREDSQGFIAGRPDSFPRFSSVGGFGPMGEVEKGNIAGNFMEEFKIPVVSIPGIREDQPQFSPLQFLNQVSVVQEGGDQPPHTASFKPFSPPSSEHEDSFSLVFPHDDASRPDPDPIPPTPPQQPPTSNDIILTTVDHRPNRPSAPPRGRAKKPTKSPIRSLLNPIRDLVRDSEARQHEDWPGMTERFQVERNRVRRTASEPDPSDPSNVPHKRVHRVQEESQVAHSRNPREFLFHNSQVTHSEVPLHFESSPDFRYRDFQVKRTSSATSRPLSFRTKGLTPVQRSSSSRVIGDVKADTPDDDILVPESQRFHPTITGRHSPSAPSAKQSFFPSPPLPPRTPGPRRARLLPQGPGFRGSSSQSEPAAFRDFRNSFYGPGEREAIHKPEFTFPSSRRPFHREQEYGKLHNSILGSGNFEVLRGGTFYDDDDPNGYNHDYDHLLDDAYAIFPGAHSSQHTNNYVDDFFSNFRDFSEFAVRKSDEGESTYLEDGAFFGRGYASEPVHRIVDSPETVRFNVSSEEKDLNTSKEDTGSKLRTMETKEHRHTESDPPAVKDTQAASNSKHHHKYRQPKNIQEVLEDIDPQPSEYSSSSLTVDDKDPMIAMF